MISSIRLPARTQIVPNKSLSLSSLSLSLSHILSAVPQRNMFCTRVIAVPLQNLFLFLYMCMMTMILCMYA